MNTIYQNDDTGQVPVSKEMADAAQDNLVASQNDVAMESPYADLEEWLKEYFGDDFTLGNVESQQRLKEFFFRNMEQNQQLASVLSEDPRLAQLLADIVNGKRNAHAAVARYYGKSFLDFEEGSPEYEEMLQMDEERRKEASPPPSWTMFGSSWSSLYYRDATPLKCALHSTTPSVTRRI